MQWLSGRMEQVGEGMQRHTEHFQYRHRYQRRYLYKQGQLVIYKTSDVSGHLFKEAMCPRLTVACIYGVYLYIRTAQWRTLHDARLAAWHFAPLATGQDIRRVCGRIPDGQCHRPSLGLVDIQRSVIQISHHSNIAPTTLPPTGDILSAG